jgi:hypothetical protein
LPRAVPGVAFRIQPHEGHHAQADLVAVDLGPVTGDESALLQGPNPAPARRSTEPDPLRKVRVGESAIGLQLIQNGEVELV